MFSPARYKITEASGDVWTNYPDTKLWQIQVPFFLWASGGALKERETQLEHDARPSISVNIIQSLNDFLKGSAGLPENVQKLQSEAGIKLILTPSEGNCCTDSLGWR